jgi:DNA-binding NtrC family response regulator
MNERKFTSLKFGLNMLLTETREPSRQRIALPARPQSIRVLLVDDFQARRQSLHHILTANGIANVTSTNVISALLKLRDAFFDVVCVCNEDFENEGFQRLTHTASISPSSQSPIVVLVREPTAETLIAARRQGADGYICPPFDAIRLLAKFAHAKNAKERGAADAIQR